MPRPSRAVLTIIAIVLTGGAMVACSDTGADEAAPTPAAPSAGTSTAGPEATPSASLVEPRVVSTVATGLVAPWGLAFLPDGSALVSQRDAADVVRVSTSGVVTPVGPVPGVVPGGEGGLLGLAVAKTFDDDRLVYAYFTSATDNRIVRMTYTAGRFGTPQVILSGLRKGEIHNGGRIAFGPDGFLYVAVGDTGDGATAQDPTSRNGKILRVTATGKPAPGNPTPGSPVYSSGHRNVQGLAWDSDGTLWASEFGQNTWDELNRIEPGGNYGWPVVEGRTDDSRYINPQSQWRTDVASPSGIAIVDDTVLMAGLRGARLWAIPVAGGTAGTPRDYFADEYGRLRTVSVASDGSVWLVTSNTDGRGNPADGDDRILRLTL